MDVIHVLGALAVGEERVGDHDGPTVHDEADLAPEGAVQPLREVGEHLREHLAREWNVFHGFQSRSDGCRRWMCCYPRCCRMRHGHLHRHRHGHMMYEGHDGGRNRLPGQYGYGLGEDLGGCFGFASGVWDDD